MARKPTDTEIILHQKSGLTENASDAADILAVAQSSYSDDRDLANQIWGQIQLAKSITKFTTVVGLMKLKEFKERKLYQALSGKKGIDKNGNEIPDVGTWDGFCRALHTSANKVDEDLLNLKIFGEDALEQLSSIGAGYRELRQYRKLPDEEKTALIEVAESGDKEALLEAAEAIIAKQAKEKESLQKEKEQLKAEHDSLQKDYKALSLVNANSNKEKDELKLKLTKFEMKTVPLDERLEPLKQQILDTQNELDRLLDQYRQYIGLFKELQNELTDADPTYDPEQPYVLPESIQVTLLSLNTAMESTFTQVDTTRRELILEFGGNITLANLRLDDLITEIIDNN